ncbi:hypothetical protein NLX86_25850 [Streptomyces sp. A3M-1-3]|uniref:hypothetical protein n=1 Tax=Streptomyces sp. A3M-1-3 TaxID=2962044 RepID=UPI0020B72B3E|nr:hypothetical protein [Streptomyces sp. A3M-1-3]MCP3821394.1 hypothetical protein [Streptomyces sp. A3M-1-3]
MAVIDRETESVLDTTRDRYGRTVHQHAAAAARARRNQAAVETYATNLAPYVGHLLDTAHSALDELPPARHTTAWRDLLDSLAVSHAEIVRVLDRPAAPGSAAEREQKTAVWPHLAAWADHGSIAADLADQHHQPEPELTDEERQMWTEMAHAAQRRGELDLIESWYAADGRRITLGYLVENDTSTVIALTGDPDAPGWEVIGHYAHEYAAGQALPRAVPPGALRSDTSRFNRPEPAPEVSLQELHQDVVEARAAGDVSETLLTATQPGYDAGPMVRMQELLHTAGQFANALETVQGRQIAARLDALGRQLDFLTREVHEAAEDLGATVAVLPPHRAPKPPRIRPRPALDTTPPAPPPRTTAPARRP